MSTTVACPECGNAVPVDSGYVQWCDCGWNLKPDEVRPPRSVAERLNRRMSERFASQLRDDVLATPPGRGHLSAATLVAVAIAAAVHLVTFAFAVVGVFLLATSWPSPLGLFAGFVLVVLATGLRPRLGKAPKHLVHRPEAPTLFSLTDDIARALGTKPVDGIVIDAGYNASIAQLGWRRRRYLTLGLPLFEVLDAQERVGVLGHEVAHAVNGDPLRGLVLGSALGTLANWYAGMQSRQVLRRRGFGALVDALAGWMMRVASLVPWGLSLALTQLAWRDSQRAEYYADELAAEAAGASAMATALEKLRYGLSARMAVHAAVLNPSARDDPRDLLEQIRDKVAGLPERERERLRRVELLPGGVPRTTHPATWSRIEFIGSRPTGSPLVTLSPDTNAAIDRELRRYRVPVERALKDSYRSSIMH